VSVDRHEIHEQSVGAYLLGALDDSELRAFEAHLDECPVCREEVERLRPAVEALPRSVVQLDPSPELKRSLLESIEAEPDAPARRRRGLGRRFGFAAAPRLAWAAAALAAVAIAAGAFAVGRGTGDDGTRVVTAKAAGSPGASASLAIPDDSAAATLRVHGMPTLAPGRTYQAWVRRGDEVIPKALFNVGGNGDGATAVDGDLAGADAVLVTREPARGSRAPTADPVLTVEL
jgi:anti-sigma-K factor RskA